MVAITYQRDVGRLLEAAEVDDNFEAVVEAIVALENDRPTPDEIVSVTRDGLELTFNLVSGATLGPIDLPAVTFHFFDAFEPYVARVELDTFVVEGVGIFTTMRAHNTGATFDADLMVDGVAAYEKIFGATSGGGDLIYDVIIPYPGRLSDLTLPLDIPALRSFRILVAGKRIARLREPPSIADQVMPLLHNATQIGTVTWLIGEELGTVVFTADEVIAEDEYFSIGLPLAPDATAAGMSLAIAAQRVL